MPEPTARTGSGIMEDMLPLFPLGTVLFPGMVLPLQVFEERYRQMVSDLQDQPEPRELGVIAIRKGGEVGAENLHELYDIGCVARVRELEPQADGRYHLVVVGSRRFRLLRADHTRPYLLADVAELPDEPAGGEATAEVAAVQAAFRDYLNALADRAGAVIRIADLPDEPVLLSYVVAAAMIIDIPERQGLLAATDGLSRLKAERQLLTRERAMLRITTSRPAPGLSHEPYNPN
ncbi:MAG TPA: LON peptidase substrate-binding domain-containing protein [Trebonia sp.]|nr:LON peptidase substrate-binding domain-containing protein [Trebonia sp.]